jgi:hypothetical protein
MQIRLPTVVAFAVNIPSLFRGVLWAIDQKGRFDAATSSLDTVGGFGVTRLLIDPPPWFYPLALVVGLLLIWWDIRRQPIKRKITMSPLAIAVAATIVCVGVWGWYFIDRQRGPIVWVFNLVSPMQFNGGGTQGAIWVFAFNVNGINRWHDSIRPTRALIQSASRTMPLLIHSDQGLVRAETASIRGDGTEFSLMAIVPSQKMPLDEVRTHYSPFTIIFEYDGRNSNYEVTTEQIEKTIAAAEKEYLPSPRPPGVSVVGN